MVPLRLHRVCSAPLLTRESSSMAFPPWVSLSRRILPPLRRILLPPRRIALPPRRILLPPRKKVKRRNKNGVGMGFACVTLACSIGGAFGQLGCLAYWCLASE